MEKTIIAPEGVYSPTAEFSQAIRVSGGDLLFISGIIGYRPNKTMPTDFIAQAENAFENLARVVGSAGGSLEDIVKVTIYIKDDFQLHRDSLRQVRARYFTSDFPVSTLIQVAGFANPDYLFEIDAIAVLPGRDS